jgi:hypothetical protein
VERGYFRAAPAPRDNPSVDKHGINPFDSPGFAVLIREANEGGLKPGVCSGLILSGAFYPDLKIGVWRRERIKVKNNYAKCNSFSSSRIL